MPGIKAIPYTTIKIAILSYTMKPLTIPSLISLLGITAAAIAFMILYNTTVSKMEQDRNRIGILQSLGVTKEQFSRHYLLVGVLVGILT